MLNKELIDLLGKAVDYFGARGFVDWEKEARESAVRVQNGDLSVIEELWLKYSPMGEIDHLLITDYQPEDEDRINALNDELSGIINPLFWLLDKAKDEIA